MVILRESRRDWLLVAAVALLAIGANLPTRVTDALGFDRRYLLAALIAVVAVSLVRYLKFTLVLVVGILAVGANLPAEVAGEFGIDPQIAMLGLVAMIVISLSNRLLKMPVGLEESSRSKSTHGAAALFAAILKGRTAVVHSLLAQGVNVNVRTVSGKTPLMAAAFKGYADVVQLLLDNGADPNIKDARGDTALKIAARGGFTRIVDLLSKSRATGAQPEPMPVAARQPG